MALNAATYAKQILAWQAPRSTYCHLNSANGFDLSLLPLLLKYIFHKEVVGPLGHSWLMLVIHTPLNFL
jgi:hypothetical protein